MDTVIDLNDLSAEENEVFSFCDKIGGHTSYEELLFLYRTVKSLPEDAKVLEIGSYRGRSAAAMGFAVKNTTKKLYCLDLWGDYSSLLDNPIETDQLKNQLDTTNYAVLQNFLENTDLFGASICHLRGKTSDFRNIFSANSFDMIFIDGAHDYENVCYDIDTAFMIIKQGGIICGHDYHRGGIGVIQAVNDKILNNNNVASSKIAKGTTIWSAIVK